MKYINKDFALKISTAVLFLAGIMDLIRGFMHTFNIRYAAEKFAKIELSSDSLVLMTAFGISNFLTGFLFLLIVWKVQKIAPYVLALIPFCYFIGSLGMRYSNVVMESEFNGQYMMAIYLTICLFTALFYFITAAIDKRKLTQTSIS
ncbi:MAG: hypothetical protein MK212_08310 [Saprospiraceae bacterium]|nr:hypothetical protein [Saprospiraceae bacterium]